MRRFKPTLPRNLWWLVFLLPGGLVIGVLLWVWKSRWFKKK